MCLRRCQTVFLCWYLRNSPWIKTQPLTWSPGGSYHPSPPGSSLDDFWPTWVSSQMPILPSLQISIWTKTSSQFRGTHFLFFSLVFLYFGIYFGCAGCLLWHTDFTVTCEILVCQSGSESGSPASRAWGLIHWTTAGILHTHFLKFKISWLFFQMLSSVRI